MDEMINDKDIYTIVVVWFIITFMDCAFVHKFNFLIFSKLPEKLG